VALELLSQARPLWTSFGSQGIILHQCPLRDLIVKEAHKRALVSHFDIDRNLEILLKEHFYWLNIGGDVHKVITSV